MRNNFRGLKDFIRRWDQADTSASSPELKNRNGPEGQINLEGLAICSKARIYTPHENNFFGAIEPGVRQLLLEFIRIFNCITYSSCEGHLLSDTSFTIRHLGILPRSPQEYTHFVKQFRLLTSKLSHEVNTPNVELKVEELILESDDCSKPCLEIVFANLANDPKLYFPELEQIYIRFLETLKRI
jgi:hypothetical protein